MTTLSLLTPSGRLTLGNLLGALRPMADRQRDAYYGISDLHAMTTPHDPALLRERTREMATLLLAAGLERSTLFRAERGPGPHRAGLPAGVHRPHRRAEPDGAVQGEVEAGLAESTPSGSRSTPTRC